MHRNGELYQTNPSTDNLMMMNGRMKCFIFQLLTWAQTLRFREARTSNNVSINFPLNDREIEISYRDSNLKKNVLIPFIEQFPFRATFTRHSTNMWAVRSEFVTAPQNDNCAYEHRRNTHKCHGEPQYRFIHRWPEFLTWMSAKCHPKYSITITLSLHVTLF